MVYMMVNMMVNRAKALIIIILLLSACRGDIDPSGSRKAHYFRDDTVVEATDMVSRDSSCRRDSIATWVDDGPVRIFTRANSGISIWREDVYR